MVTFTGTHNGQELTEVVQQFAGGGTTIWFGGGVRQFEGVVQQFGGGGTAIWRIPRNDVQRSELTKHLH